MNKKAAKNTKSNAKNNKKYDYDTSTISGIHIYEDEKGRKIYYKPRTMTGYVIKEENVKTYRMLSNRYILGILTVIFSYFAFGDSGLHWSIFLLLGIIVFLILQYRFHRMFLPKLVQIHNYVPKQKPNMIETIAQQEEWRLFTKIILYPIFGALLLWDFYLRESEIGVLAAGYVILAFCFIYAFINLRGYFYKRANAKQS